MGHLSVVTEAVSRSEHGTLSEPAASGSDQRGVEAHLPWPSPRTSIRMSDTEPGLSAEDITSTKDTQFFFPAWAISLTLHGAVVGLAFVFATQVKPILQEDVFQWDVALVEAAKSPSSSELVESVTTPAQPEPKVVPTPRPRRITEVSPMVQPPEQPIEPIPLNQQQVEAPQVHENQVEQRIVEVTESKTEPVAEATVPELLAVAASPDPVEAQPVQQEPAAMTSAPSLSAEAPLVPQRAVDAVGTPGAEAKADNRWLAESLWRRVAELKRYPSSARLNGQEGKVILKAVIRSDGQLADVIVQKSSGYSALDAAAMEAVKLACPLEMKHAIGKPQIVVSLPIVYSLAN